MLVTPVLVGSWPTFAWPQLLLLLVALVAYLALHAVGLWLKAGRRARYLPPARAYTVVTVLLLVALVAIEPRLLAWAPLYVVGVALSLWASARRDDRSWWNDVVLVVLACGATLVAAGLRPVTDGVAVLAIAPSPFAWPPPGLLDRGAQVAALVLLLYFLGTVVHVKALIRERRRPAVRRASAIYHGALVVVALVVALVPASATVPAWSAVALAIALLVRAVAIPRWWPGATPKQLGIVEIVATVAVAVVAVLLAGSV